MKNYFLPEKIRPKLKKIWGKAIFGKKEKVFKKYQDFIKRGNFKKIITVGDYCSINFDSNVKIFDGKIERKKIKKILDYSLFCKNPPGQINADVWPKIKKAIKENKNVFVEGEEDLLVIPAVLLSKKGSLIIYGSPKRGICLIEVSEKIKRKIKSLLLEFHSA
jgi:uncharacterized protein (UPF0218 family)